MLTWPSAVRLLITSTSAISRSVRPSATRPATSLSRRGSRAAPFCCRPPEPSAGFAPAADRREPRRPRRAPYGQRPLIPTRLPTGYQSVARLLWLPPDAPEPRWHHPSDTWLDQVSQATMPYGPH